MMMVFSLILLTVENDSDRDKLEHIYDMYSKQMYRVAYSVLHNTEDAKDAVQETFLRLASVISTLEFDDEARCRSYVLTAVKNTAISIGMKNSKMITKDYESIAEAFGDTKLDPETIISGNESFESIVNAIKAMNELYRDVLYYRIVEGMSEKDIAALLGIKYSTVRIRIKRGKEELIRLITEKEEYAYEL